MDLKSPAVRRTLALVIAVAGILIAWFALDAVGLLVAVAAMCIWLRARMGFVAVVAGSLIWAGILLLRPPVEHDGLVRFAIFVAAALGVWLLVQVFRTTSMTDMLDQNSSELVVEDIPGLGWIGHPDGRLRYINPDVLALIGVSAEEMRKMLAADPLAILTQYSHPDEVERNLANWNRTLETGEPLIDESLVRRYDGEYRWLRDTVVPTRDRHGRITAWYAHSVDITDQKNAEEALRRSERELRVLVDTVPTMIFLTDPQGRPYYFNKRFTDWVGIDPGGEVVPIVDGVDPYAAYLHPDDRESVVATVYGGFARGESMQYRSRLRNQDGEYRWLDSRVEPLRDEDGKIIRWYGVLIDIDDEVRAQESLRLADERLSRASRAASLSELSVSIAHELNSPLQAVVANANAFQRWLTAKPPNYERAGLTAERIIRDANAAAEVISRIRSLFAQTEQGRAPTDLNGIIAEVCDLVADRLQSSSVRLELALEPDLPLVLADRVQVEQVIINLVRNAIEAMHDTPPPGRLLRVSSRRNDDVVEIEVNDRGHGIPDPDRIFEAFYTTKKEGMGMGLAICRSIIESHEGRISAKSAPGEGSSVSFILPVYSEPDARVSQ